MLLMRNGMFKRKWREFTFTSCLNDLGGERHRGDSRESAPCHNGGSV